MKNPFINYTGLVAPLDTTNVDTDAIIPKQFLKRIEKSGYGKFLFYDWRFEDGKENRDFILNQENYRASTILLTRKNFGCGSSREHAPWALVDYGFLVIIAPSFADIFYNNCFKNGILPIVLHEKEIDELFQLVNDNPGYQLTINLETQNVQDNEDFAAKFKVDSYRKDMLMKGLDEIGSTLGYIDKINVFERNHKVFFSL